MFRMLKFTLSMLCFLVPSLSLAQGATPRDTTKTVCSTTIWRPQTDTTKSRGSVSVSSRCAVSDSTKSATQTRRSATGPRRQTAQTDTPATAGKDSTRLLLDQMNRRLGSIERGVSRGNTPVVIRDTTRIETVVMTPTTSTNTWWTRNRRWAKPVGVGLAVVGAGVCIVTKCIGARNETNVSVTVNP